jgi:hypothetical protein
MTLKNYYNINTETFSGCNKLERLIFIKDKNNNEVPQITFNSEALEGCSSLESIHFIENKTSYAKIQRMESNALNGCTNLTAIYFSKDAQISPEAGLNTCSNLTIFCEGEKLPNYTGEHPIYYKISDFSLETQEQWAKNEEDRVCYLFKYLNQQNTPNVEVGFEEDF